MAQQPIIASRYCVPNPSHLSIKASGSPSRRSYYVTDVVNQNLIFKVQWDRKIFASHMLLVAPAGNAIVKLRLKPGTQHSRWQVFRGDSDIPLFSAKASSNGFYKTKLDGFLARNTAERFRDFSVQATRKKFTKPPSAVIYAGDNTSTLLAEIEKENTWAVCCFGWKEEFKVTVRPNIDYAFVVAVTVILNEISSSDD